jgi:hypothetical protein
MRSQFTTQVTSQFATQFAAMVLLAAIGGSLYAAEKTRVDVYINDRDDSSQLLGPGKVLAAGIFGKIGVRLVWHNGELPAALPTNASLPVFAIRTSEHALESATNGALASARIVGSSGTEITVYKDRLHRFLADHASAVNVAAGYVLAHELAHVMQGVARHSESGIMKGHWAPEDCQAMVFHKLAFTQLDVDLIHQGLAVQRASRQSEPVVVAESVSPAVFDSAKK